MKIILLAFVLLVVLYSCEQVGFEEAQPINALSLKEFPKEIRGKYGLKLLDFNQKSSKEDTIEIGVNYYQSNKEVKIYLSDTVTFRKYKNYFVFSYKEKKYWTVILAQQQKDKNIFLYAILDAKSEKTAEELSKITTVNTIRNSKKSKIRHSINPSKAEFKKIVKQDFFTKMFKMEKFE